MRVGVTSIQTAQEKLGNDEHGARRFYPGQNYTTVAFQHKPFSRSNVGVIYSQRQSLSRVLFINALIQLNTQTEKVNIYGKVQWRHRPLSDIFLVYTSNKAANSWKHQDQNVVLR
jgi:hypothetical protein